MLVNGMVGCVFVSNSICVVFRDSIFVARAENFCFIWDKMGTLGWADLCCAFRDTKVDKLVVRWGAFCRLRDSNGVGSFRRVDFYFYET